MARRSNFVALIAGLAALYCSAGYAQQQQEPAAEIARPVLRPSVTVNSDLVLIGDMIENAGAAAGIAIYRAPDIGTTGSLPTTKVLAALRAHRVIGVDTRDIREVTVSRLSRTIDSQEIESEVIRALSRQNNRSEHATFNLKFDREPQDVQLDPSNVGTLEAVAVRHDSRTGRFDITFEIAHETGGAPIKLRYTGTAIETVEAAVLTRSVERNELVRSSDVVIERRPRSEVGPDVLDRGSVVGMQARRALRPGQPLRTADLTKPDLVQRDQGVTLIYEAPGIYLTMRGKAMENGAEGDVVNVLNLQSKRTISGIVIGRGQVSLSAGQSRQVASVEAVATTPADAGKPE